jgi:hypothetical protein
MCVCGCLFGIYTHSLTHTHKYICIYIYIRKILLGFIKFMHKTKGTGREVARQLALRDAYMCTYLLHIFMYIYIYIYTHTHSLSLPQMQYIHIYGNYCLRSLNFMPKLCLGFMHILVLCVSWFYAYLGFMHINIVYGH